MKLERLTERIFIYPYEEERDRPNLSYIKGDRWSLAVDAGHSESHTREFYEALCEAGLPLPALTVLTHWHWDHTFGMHAVHGLCLANEKTNRHLLDFRDRLEKEGPEFFLAMHESIRREYAGGKPVIVTPADMVFRGEVLLDAGNCPIRVFEAEAPHTDDSTLIEVPGEQVLILGDSTGGTFPDWTMDMALAAKLAETVRKINPKLCIDGHWTPLTPEVIIEDLLAGEG
ncbi:MAG: MBL fold metallo-hydrolase [Lachnospiraceae bacterium]|nr:MBL fold metallo-hydrolase [Lachnospiraceae bacterium]